MKFVHNLLIASVVNLVLALMFAPELDNISNPMPLFAVLTLITAFVLTLIQRRNKAH